MIELLIEREGGVARTVRLREGVFVLGRADTADIVLDDSEVSRRHARLLVDDGDVVVEDLGTQNGTWVGGERVEQP
jgi:pSer/pThr/pTyr-binding forkhead associated (FHA) protein